MLAEKADKILLYLFVLKKDTRTRIFPVSIYRITYFSATSMYSWTVNDQKENIRSSEIIQSSNYTLKPFGNYLYLESE